MPKPFWIRRRFPAESNSNPRGCIKSPATLTAFHPGAVEWVKWKADTPEHDDGIPLCTGPGVEVGRTLVLSVVVGEEAVGIGLEIGALLEGGGVSGIKFADTSLSKSVFFPSDKSRVQWPNEL